MPRTATSALYLARARVSSREGWRLFVEIPSTVSGSFRLVDDNRHCEADGKVWQAAGIVLSLPEEELEGTLGEVRLSIPNISRLPLAHVETGDILGQSLTAWIAHSANLASFASGNALRFEHRIVKADCTEKVMTLSCRHVVAGMTLPRGRYTREQFPQLRVV